MQSRNNLLRLTLLLLAAVLIANAGVKSLRGFAQSTEESWTDPINLSHSGSTSDPVAVVDSNGKIHVIWKDEFADWVYTSGNEAGWSKPVAADYVFTDQVPHLYSDASGGIQVLWIDEEGALYQGWSRPDGFSSPGTWSGTQLVGAAAATYDMALDSQGVLHMAYVRNLDTADFPAGVYYRSSQDNGASWSNPVSLYASSYMRSLTDKTASIDIAVTDAGGVQDVYVAWDNPQLKRVFLMKSGDGGQTWGDATMIDGPTTTTVSTGPFHLKVNPDGQNVLVVWNTSLQSDFDCTQLSQYSIDGGKTWSERQVMFDNFVGCPGDNQFIQGEGGLTLLMSSIQDEAFLTAWDGARWSESQPQAALFSFTDQENIRSVDFRCRQVLKTGPDHITVVGCDQAGGGDIWATSNSIGEVETWYPPLTAWTKPQVLTTAEIADGSITALSDNKGAFHAVWNQLQTDDKGVSKWKVYYTRQEDDKWSDPVAVLDSPAGSVDAPSAVIDAKDRLYVVWRDDLTGEIYFSWANASLANSTFEWVSAQVLPNPQGGGSSPDVELDPNGDLVIAYAVPVNEGRGIYVTRSADAGETWSTPVQAFDGVANGWIMVDHPKLAITDDGVFHMVWTRNLLGEGNPAMALYYAQSIDGGQSWSDAELVAEQPIAWAAVEGAGQGDIHRLWLGAEGESSSMWDQNSIDGGGSWEQAINLTRFGETPGPASLTKDALGRLNLMQAVSDVGGKAFIRHWTWENGVWNELPSLSLGEANALKVTSLGANTSVDGRLLAVFAQDDTLDNLAIESLRLTGRQSVQVVPDQATPAAGEIATVVPVASVTPKSPPPTSTVTDVPTDQSVETTSPAAPTLAPVITPTIQSGPVSVNSRLSGPVVGGVLALLVVGLAAGLTIAVVRRSASKR